MGVEFEPIILHYDGLDTDHKQIDLAQLGLSLQGAAQILGSAASVVVTGEYAKTALAVRVLAGIPREGSWDLPAIIMTGAPAAMPIFPVIADMGKKATTKAVTSIFSYVVSKLGSPKKSDVQAAMDVAEKSLVEAGQTMRHAIDAVERIASNQRPAVRLFVTPIGDTCDTVRVGKTIDGAISVGRTMRAQIEQPDQVQIGNAANFEILLSELDLKNRSCKFSLRSDLDPERRVSGDITDPIILNPNNPYSEALSKQRWLPVIAKAQLKEGEMEKLFISDIASPKSLAK